MTHRVHRNLWKAIPYMVIAGACVALQGALVKFLSPHLATETIFFGRSFAAFLLILAWVCVRYKLPDIKKFFNLGSVKLSLVRSGVGAIAALLYYYSVKTLSVSSATVLYMTLPVFVPIVARIGLHTKIAHRVWWGLGVAFIGVLCVMQPNTTIHWMSLLGLVSGVLGAVSAVINRILHYHESPTMILFRYFLVALGVATLVFIIRLSISGVALEKHTLVFMGVMGVCGLAFQAFFSLALKYSSARVVTPCIYFSLIFAVILDKIFWQKNPAWLEIVGMVAIVLGVILVVILSPKETISPYLELKKKS